MELEITNRIHVKCKELIPKENYEQLMKASVSTIKVAMHLWALSQKPENYEESKLENLNKNFNVPPKNVSEIA